MPPSVARDDTTLEEIFGSAAPALQAKTPPSTDWAKQRAHLAALQAKEMQELEARFAGMHQLTDLLEKSVGHTERLLVVVEGQRDIMTSLQEQLDQAREELGDAREELAYSEALVREGAAKRWRWAIEDVLTAALFRLDASGAPRPTLEVFAAELRMDLLAIDPQYEEATPDA